MSRAGGVLVVGAGQAAVELAVALRDGGYDGPVTLVGEEEHAPYQRPLLSKAYVQGGIEADALLLRSEAFYRERGVELVLGERVEEIQAEPGGGEARCRSGRRIRYATLVLATGAGARMLSVPGADAPGVHVLRSLADADRLADALRRAERVVVIGGGFVGLEVAATACLAGRSVTVLEAAGSLMGRAVGPVTAAEVLSRHRAAGIDVRLDAEVAGIEQRGAGGPVTGVALVDGTRLAADLVVVGIGADARTELAESLGLTCERGVVVDAFSRTSDGHTLAIGDCAVLPDPSPWARPSSKLRLESVDNAVEQAKSAASTILGRPSAYASVPWFWSDQGDLKLQMAGLREAADVGVVRRCHDSARLVVAYYRAGAMVAVEAVDAPADFMLLRRALGAGVSLDPDAFVDCAKPLRALLKEAADALSAV